MKPHAIASESSLHESPPSAIFGIYSSHTSSSPPSPPCHRDYHKLSHYRDADVTNRFLDPKTIASTPIRHGKASTPFLAPERHLFVSRGPNLAPSITANTIISRSTMSRGPLGHDKNADGEVSRTIFSKMTRIILTLWRLPKKLIMVPKMNVIAARQGQGQGMLRAEAAVGHHQGGALLPAALGGARAQ
jgi:hypothetical protein